ncbi:MAG TPA: zinc ribbon domain-containing protein, partial [Streptosporangiaceae bacterium]
MGHLPLPASGPHPTGQVATAICRNYLCSQTCSQCKTTDREARESQAVFRCRACGYCGNADVNAARNIAAGHAVTARGGDRVTGPVIREPQDD